jgi:hypothetical protein
VAGSGVSGALARLVAHGLLKLAPKAGQGRGASKPPKSYALKRWAEPLLGYVLALDGYLPSVADQALATDADGA